MQALSRISSVPVKGYEKLPRLKPPKGYVCVIHDQETGNYNIGQTKHPAALLKRWSRERPNRYELERIFKAADAAELREILHQRYKGLATGKLREWFKLRSSHLRELDGFIAQASAGRRADAGQLRRWDLRYFVGDSYKQLPRLQLPRGYVYVLKDLYTENYKIGYTNHPIVRLGYLEMKASGEVKYVHILKSDQVKETETYLHERYDACRTRSYEDWEWFRLNEAQLQEIRNLAWAAKSSPSAAPKPAPSRQLNHHRQVSATGQSIVPRAPGLSEDTQPSKAHAPNSRQKHRSRRFLVYLLAIVLIAMAGVLVYALNSADGFAFW